MDRSASSSTGSFTAGRSRILLPETSQISSSSAAGVEDSQQSKQSSTSTSLSQSPVASRDVSPTRSRIKASTSASRSASAAAATSRSRRNSQQETSPVRTPRSVKPILPPGSNTISAATTPTLLPVSSDLSARSSGGPQKTSIITEQPYPRDSPRWPISPRLRSPPPQLHRPNISTTRRIDTDPPRINVQRATPSPQPPALTTDGASNMSESDTEDSQSGIRTPAMGNGSTLETVQEVSQPNSPGHINAALEAVNERLSGEGTVDYPTLRAARSAVPVSEAGSDYGTIRADPRRSQSSAPPPALARQPSTVSMSAKQPKTKAAGEGAGQSMTVETETVSSVPQVALAPNSKMESSGGTLKAKPSTETIKPRKDKKKVGRKQPAVTSAIGETPLLLSNTQSKLRHHQSMRSVSVATSASLSPTRNCEQGLPEDGKSGTGRFTRSGTRAPGVGFYQMSNLLTKSRSGSSKADIFEAKVASAVDEADSSDSEETFVYDSNPPDAGDRPRRYHSRTPSATSMASQADRNAMRSIHSIMENGGGPPPVIMKKGMKFVNSFVGSGGENSTPGDDDGKGSGRSAGPGSGRGTARHHHHNLTHIGRWGRNPGNTHTSLFDNDSPFPNAARSKFSGVQSRQSSGPPSPRFLNHARGPSGTGKRSSASGPAYDLDDPTTGADDERTPLLSPSMRSARGRSRRNPATLRHLESQTYRQKPSYLNRFAACLVITMMLLLVITGAIGFMFATSQPLMDIELVSIKNVLASDPELMFDLTVKAHNPNIVVVSVDQANIEVFAKSQHAGSDTDWWKWPHGPEMGDGLDSDIHIKDDPPNDPPDDAPNMRLGTITEFDSPLSFEGSFFNKGVSSSTGEMRLSLPGNHSAGGSERWSRIIQDEFDLVIKGVVRYSLPLSQRVRSAPISGRATVKPNSANDPSFNSTLLAEEEVPA